MSTRDGLPIYCHCWPGVDQAGPVAERHQSGHWRCADPRPEGTAKSTAVRALACLLPDMRWSGALLPVRQQTTLTPAHTALACHRAAPRDTTGCPGGATAGCHRGPGGGDAGYRAALKTGTKHFEPGCWPQRIAALVYR